MLKRKELQKTEENLSPKLQKKIKIDEKDEKSRQIPEDSKNNNEEKDKKEVKTKNILKFSYE